MTVSASILDVYRVAVDDLMIELAAHIERLTPDSLHKVEKVLAARLPDQEFADLLTRLPGGATTAQANLIAEIESYRPEWRNSAADLGALIRIGLLAQIDALWWGEAQPYQCDLDVETAVDLVDLDTLPIRFHYRRQVTTFAGRVVRAVERRAAPHRTPRTAGLRFTQARPEVVALIDNLATDFAAVTPAGTPPLWVNSLTRSVQHQHRLRALGYAAMLPSSHCTGYGIDIEMSWYRRCGADVALQRVLLARQNTGEINVIGEGQAWHVCVSPAAIDALRASAGIGG